MRFFVKDNTGRGEAGRNPAGRRELTITALCAHGLGLSPLSCQSDKHLSEWPRNDLKAENETKIL